MANGWHTGPGIGVLDARYVNTTGDTMTGALTINTNSTTALVVEDSGNNTLVVDTTNARVGIGITDPEVIDASGNVGIGTTDPGANLEIADTSKSGLQFIPDTWGGRILTTTGGSGSVLYLQPADGGVRINTSGVNNYFDIYDTSGNRDILLATNGDSWINGAGNVGIGITEPEGKLHIYQGDAGIAPNVNLDDLVIESTSNAGINILTGTTNRAYIGFGDNRGTVMGWIDYEHDNDSMAFRVNNSERMRIDSTGNVGIGTTNPSGRLHINGTADDQQLIVEGHSTQTANLQENQDSSANVLSGVDQRGILFSYGGVEDTNFFAGKDAGNVAATGTNNVGIGTNALDALTSGVNNIAIGNNALGVMTSGNNNLAFGNGALSTAGSGATLNVALGNSALSKIVSGDRNTAIGDSAGENTTGGSNTIIGNNAYNVGTGSNNVAIGQAALRKASSFNTAIGISSGENITGSRNIIIGREAGSKQVAVDDMLLISNQTYTDAATELTNSILYGVLASTPGAQSLRINANLKTSQGRIKNTTRVTTTYTILVTDNVIFANTDGAAWTATLPVGVEGQTFKIINSGSSANNLTLAPNGAEHLMGANSSITLADGISSTITYNATDGWY